MSDNIEELKNEIFEVKISPSGIHYTYDLKHQLTILQDKTNEMIRAINELKERERNERQRNNQRY